MYGCSCLSINVHLCPLEDVKAVAFLKDMTTQNFTTTVKGELSPYATVCMLVDLILPSKRQQYKCFVSLFLYIAIIYIFTPIRVFLYVKGSAPGRLFKV